MKFSLILISALLFAPSVNAMPFGRTSGSFEQCNRYKYNERYVPGYYNKHGQYVGGYVKSEKVKLPCISDTFRANNSNRSNTNAVSVVLPLVFSLLQ